MVDKRVSVTVLTGFLGSGKTTLLNRILREDHGLRYAVIENEYGEIGIDDQLVKSKVGTKEEFIEMNNGCICCTVRGDLIRVLKKLLSRGGDKKLDGIIIETTGLADPGPVVQTFFVDETIKAKARLDAVVTVVDLVHLLTHLDDPARHEGAENESLEQLAFADTILLNKSDLVTEEEILKVEARIFALNKTARRQRCVQCEVPLTAVLGLQAFSLERALDVDPEFLDEAATHVHDTSITSVGLTMPGEMDNAKLNDRIAELLRVQGVDIFRMKGVMAVKNQPKLVFQGVHMIFMGEPLCEWEADEPRVSKLVFIGRNLDRAALTAAFQSCLA